jgi:iron(II)-dependent oxidoreductase
MDGPNAVTLSDWLRDARRWTLALIADLTDAQWRGPHLPIVNPLLWEVGHIAWFQEKWILRRRGQPSLRPDADALYDSSLVAHNTRWDLPLPGRQQTLAYMEAVLGRVLQGLARGVSHEDRYYFLLALFHEDMHTEAFAYTRQTLAYPPPCLPLGRTDLQSVFPGGTDCKSVLHRAPEQGPCVGDVAIPGGTFLLGASPEEPFVFDNEKQAHPIEVMPFLMARAPVTQAEFAAFVDEGGYERQDFWSEAGWRWRQSEAAQHPVYWQRQGRGVWYRRNFDAWVPLEPHRPVLHVNWYEAEAYCRWAGRRLPTEAEWELAAAGCADSGGQALSMGKRRFPWGDGPPGSDRANLDGLAGECVDVAGCAAGDSFWGCRQLIGNVWEWTASDFLPYPGFVIGPYRDYSRPWFGTHKVLRGGCWVTRGRLLRNTLRNYYQPNRRDVWAGFRTCTLSS